jgi:hypothetical protein
LEAVTAIEGINLGICTLVATLRCAAKATQTARCCSRIAAVWERRRWGAEGAGVANLAARTAVLHVDAQIHAAIASVHRTSAKTFLAADRAVAHRALEARIAPVAAHTAVVIIGLWIHAARAGVGRARLITVQARQRTSAVAARESRVALRPAAAAVVRIALRVEAHVAALRRSTTALERALPHRANFGIRSVAPGVAHAAVGWIALKIDALVAAERETGSTLNAGLRHRHRAVFSRIYGVAAARRKHASQPRNPNDDGKAQPPTNHRSHVPKPLTIHHASRVDKP